MTPLSTVRPFVRDPHRRAAPTLVSRRQLPVPRPDHLRLLSVKEPATGMVGGKPVMTLLDDDRPAGLALVFPAGSSTGQGFIADPVSHCVHVVDQNLRPLFSFGEFGSGASQFNTPSDLTIVSAAPGSPSLTEDTAVLAVADRGNDRVQLFELDGAFLAVLEGSQACDDNVTSWWTEHAGAPLFRLTPLSPLPKPSRLVWRPPFLDVASADGGTVSVNLELALLPEFEAWLEYAPAPTLRTALSHFLAESQRGQVPQYCLRQMAERLHDLSGPLLRLA